jgi:hypothetical protein
MKRSYAGIAVIFLGSLLAPLGARANSDVPIGPLGITGEGFMLYQTGSGPNALNFVDWCPLNAGTPGARRET